MPNSTTRRSALLRILNFFKKPICGKGNHLANTTIIEQKGQSMFISGRVPNSKPSHRARLLGALDLMIAVHAVERDAMLVTSDPAFGAVPWLRIEDSTAA
jgi:hypothetical protein